MLKRMEITKQQISLILLSNYQNVLYMTPTLIITIDI